MTALKKYDRLEGTGLWRENPQDQRREVVVRLGDATLILCDPKTETALSHWSLPAIERTNPGQTPPIYAPGATSSETLELSDPDMILALDTVHGAVLAAIPRPGRLRGAILGSLTLAVLAAGAFWVPGALVAHTVSVVPAAKRAEIGQRILDDLSRLTGSPCDNQLGLQALASVADRVFGPVNTPILYVVPNALGKPLNLPGDVIVLPRSLIEKASGPEEVAGAALVEKLRAAALDPMIPILNYAGLAATFRLLTTGELPGAALRGYGEELLNAGPVPVDDAAALSGFESAQIPASPYALAMDPTGKATAGLIAGDPYKGLAPSPLIPDDDWIALQSICSK